MSSVGGYICMVVMATASVYAGAHGSLHEIKPTAAGEKDKEEKREEPVMLHFTSEIVWVFPVLASIMLGGIYLAVKLLGREVISWFIGWCFSLRALYSCTYICVGVTRNLMGSERYWAFAQYHFNLQKGKDSLMAFSWRTPSFLVIPLGTVPFILYRATKNGTKSPLLNNILALSLAHEWLSVVVKIDSFKTGCILLSGLFLYDVYWVFGTNVMAAVATKLDAPMKLLWPRDRDIGDLSKGSMMLGLGDIIMPGIFVALALRYDRNRSLASGGDGTKFHKPYFLASIFAYVLGLATTMFMAHVFKAMQPALLYLSPACVLSFVLTAAVKGELKEAWAWSDERPQTGEQVDSQGSVGDVTIKKDE